MTPGLLFLTLKIADVYSTRERALFALVLIMLVLVSPPETWWCFSCFGDRAAQPSVS